MDIFTLFSAEKNPPQLCKAWARTHDLLLYADYNIVWSNGLIFSVRGFVGSSQEAVCTIAKVAFFPRGKESEK